MPDLKGIFDNKGTPLDKQRFTWREMAGKPISKLDDDAFTRIRIILLNGVEQDALRLKHYGARFHRDLQLPLARIRRVEQHQMTSINWLLSADHSPLETTIAYEQVATEVTAAVALNEPDPYQAQTYRFGLLEDFDHLYRYAAMLDRLEGKDANNILQGYTDIIPARPTSEHHRAPEDDLRLNYRRAEAALITKIHAALITAAEFQTHDYYMNIGPTFSDPLARQLYAEIASIEEQHVTQYGSLMDTEESFLEKWLIHEAMEVYIYDCCAQQEDNPRVRQMWERFLDYELGQLTLVRELFKTHERRDPVEVLGDLDLPTLHFRSHRDFVRKVLEEERDLRAKGTRFVDKRDEGEPSQTYRRHVHDGQAPSSAVSGGYQWAPGTELTRKIA